MPLETGVHPVVEPLFVGPRLHEELELHLLELARPENEVPRRDLVPERLPDLGDSEGDLLARRRLNIQEVYVGALSRLGPQIDHGRIILHRPHKRLEHEVEEAGFTEGVLGSAGGTLTAFDLGEIGAKAPVAVATLDERIREAVHVPRGLPNLRMHQDRRVEPLDIVTLMHHCAPPAFFDVTFQFDTERTVVPHRPRSTVDLGRLEDESPALGQGRKLIHH